jgi:hypothetical protein
MFQFVMVVCVVSLLMIACDPQRAKGEAFFFSLDTGVECQSVLGPLERLQLQERYPTQRLRYTVPRR